jgi:uncharacterized sporulation protein YeaH/YhbH (DUF444 family)
MKITYNWLSAAAAFSLSREANPANPESRQVKRRRLRQRVKADLRAFAKDGVKQRRIKAVDKSAVL